MTYVMTDIHGRGKAFERMLSYINFSSTDKLFILGDVIDRGTDGLDILRYCRKHSNIVLLKGNHELMCEYALSVQPEYNDNPKKWDVRLWYQNGGDITHSRIKSEEEARKIIKYIKSLPYYYFYKENGTNFLFVHAGLSCPNYIVQGTTPDEILQYNIENETIVWMRDGWLTASLRRDYFPDYKIIHGHTFKRLPCCWENSVMNIDTGAGRQAYLTCYNLSKNILYTYDLKTDEFGEEYAPKEYNDK